MRQHHAHRHHLLGRLVDHGDGGVAGGQRHQQAVGVDPQQVGVAHPITRAIAGIGDELALAGLHHQLALGARHQRQAVGVGVDAEAVGIDLVARLGFADRQHGDSRDRAARGQDLGVAIGQRGELAADADGAGGRVAHGQREVLGRQHHAGLVGKAAGELQLHLVAGAHAQHAAVEIHRQQLGVADVDGQRGRPRRRVAVVGHQGDGGGADEILAGAELQRAAVAGDARRAVGGRGDAQAQAVIFRVGQQAAHGPVKAQVDVCLQRRGACRGRLVGHIAQVGIQQLRVAGIDDAVEVEIGRRVVGTGACRSHQVGIAAVDTLVAIGIASNEDAHRVATGTGARQLQQLQAGMLKPEQRKGLVALHAGQQRAQTGNLRQRGCQIAGGGGDHHAEQHRAAGAGVDLALAHREGEALGGTGGQGAGAGGADIGQRGAQVTAERLAHRGAAAVADGGAARGGRDQAQAAQAVVGITRRLRGAQVAHRDQAALRVIVIGEDIAVGQHHGADAPTLARYEAQQVAVAGRNTRVGDHQAHTVGVLDAGHALRHHDLVAGAVGGHQRVLGALGQQRAGVVGPAAIQAVEAPACAHQLGVDRFQLPGHAGIGHPLWAIEAHPRLGHFLWREAEAGAFAAGQREEQARALQQRRKAAQRLAAGGNQVGHQVDIAPGQAPAAAKSTGTVSGQ